jgi:uracil-DNA glycosylase
MSDAKLPETWKAELSDVLASDTMLDLKKFLLSEKYAGKTIFPKGAEYFNALNYTPLPDVKIVILGQDPYHGDGQAHGLSFSVKPDVKIPPSLRNIYKELADDLGIEPPNHGYLEPWARQGVLLLNSVLTVENGLAASHQGKGWEAFTDAVIHAVNDLDTPVVFMLWGSHAQKKAAFVNKQKHLILTAPHPSPLSAHRGFLGCGHFSKANDFLALNGRGQINWKLPQLDAIKLS